MDNVPSQVMFNLNVEHIDSIKGAHKDAGDH